MDLPNWFQYNLKSTVLNGGDFGMTDIIEVWDSDYFVHKRTGDVYTVNTKIKELAGKKDRRPKVYAQAIEIYFIC